MRGEVGSRSDPGEGLFQRAERLAGAPHPPAPGPASDLSPSGRGGACGPRVV